MEFIISIIFAIVTTVAFYFGLITGQRLSKGQTLNPDVNLPEINKHIPFTSQYKEDKEIQKETEKMNTIWENINNYNGTAEGQRRIE